MTRLASNEIFSPSHKIHREVGRAKDLSAPLYGCPWDCGEFRKVRMDQLVVLLCGRTEYVTGAGCTHCVCHEDIRGSIGHCHGGRTTRCPNYGGLGGSQKLPGLGRTEKSVVPAGMRNQNCPCRGLVTVLTELSRIH